MKLIVCKDGEEVGARAADLFRELALEAIRARGSFNVVLSGGSTPRRLYSLLAVTSSKQRVPWHDVRLFWGDERAVPADHADSNYRMVKETLLKQGLIPDDNVFAVPVTEAEPNQAAARYEETLRSFFRLEAGELPCFDLVLLGLGEDGHTASLFPGTAALRETERLVVANYVDHMRAWRITLTFPVFNNARHVVFLISGAGKARVLREVLEGPDKPDRLPSQKIRPRKGRLVFLVDRAAAGRLSQIHGRPGTWEAP